METLIAREQSFKGPRKGLRLGLVEFSTPLDHWEMGSGLKVSGLPGDNADLRHVFTQSRGRNPRKEI